MFDFYGEFGWLKSILKAVQISHLDRHLDQLDFAVKKLQTRMQNY